MEQRRLTFFFRVGQTVCWFEPTGPRYVIRARVYVEGHWPAGYTAGIPRAATEGPQTLYRLVPEHNVLGGFWAPEKDLYVCWEEHDAPAHR